MMRNILHGKEKLWNVSREEMMEFIHSPLDDLLSRANELRRLLFGNRVGLCAIVNAKSGLCAEDCKFCAQSVRYRTGAAVYPMLDKKEIVARARQAKEMGAGQFGIVTSGGRLNPDEIGTMCEIIRVLKDELGIMPCASLGELDKAAARELKEAGLKRYHHNLECSERFFPRVCTTHEWRDRVRTVSAAKRVGLEVCSGGIFGLGEAWEDRIDLAVALRELEVDSVPLNFLMPVSGTPYQSRPLLLAEDALRIIALFRLTLPRAEIRIAGGREHVLGAMQHKMFLAGANGMMIGDYLTTKGRKSEDDLRMIRESGLEIEGMEPRPEGTPSEDAHGFSPRIFADKQTDG